MCSHCGYCAPVLNEGSEKSRQIVNDPQYLNIRNDDTMPRKAREFLCWSYIQEQLGDLIDAGIQSLYGAWICDDEYDKENAQKCRKSALALFQAGRENGLKIVEQTGMDEAILADLCRRCAEFDEAINICHTGLQKEINQTVKAILNFQILLATHRDQNVYTIGDALNPGKYKPPALQRKADKKKPLRAIKYDGKTKTGIMLVDDEDTLIYSLKISLKNALADYDIKIFSAQTGDEALRILKENIETIKIIITDINHPGINGLELTRVIKNSHPDIMVIIMTAMGGEHILAECREAADRVFLKPFFITEFIEIIKKSLTI